MTSRAAILIGAVLGGLLLSAQPAVAQFPGDVFFEVPSIAAPKGKTATFNVQAFMGTAVYGAVHLDVTFDPAKVELVSVHAGDSPELGTLNALIQSGKVSLITMNDGSSTTPIGTASVAKLVVRAIGTAGTIAPIQIQVRSLLNQNSVKVTARGFAGELAIGPPSAAVTSPAHAAAAVVAESSDEDFAATLQARARALAPEGSTVTMHSVTRGPDGAPTVVASTVRVASTQPLREADVIVTPPPR